MWSYDHCMKEKFDHFDVKILNALQRDSSLSQRALAEAVGLSQNACWRRLKALEASGVIKRRTVVLDREMLGLSFVAFMFVKTRSHSGEWLKKFQKQVRSLPEVVDFYRISGNYDYLLKVLTRDMAHFDLVYQRLIDGIELEAVTSYFSMEALEEARPTLIP